MTNKYSINLLWSDEDGGYIATCPEFPGLSAFGEKAEDALHEAQVAIGLFIKTYEAEGIPIPEPQQTQEYSGQFRVRLPKSLHRRLSEIAEKEGVSLNQLVLNSLAQTVGGQKVRDHMSKDIRQAVNAVQSYIMSAQLINWGETIPEIRIEKTVKTGTVSTRTVTTTGRIETHRKAN